MEVKYYVIIACFGLAVFLFIKEVKRSDSARLIERLIANLVMVTCFALLIIPIHYTTKKETTASELNFYTEKANPFVDLHYYLKTHPEIKKINVYGYGFNNQELKKITDYELSFHPSAIPSGFLSASWPKQLKATEALTVQGSYQNSTNFPVKLKLFGFGKSLDSVSVKANAKINFAFSHQPKQIGKAVFNLMALQDGDTLSREPIPFEVAPKQPIRVLILASFPDFEYKFLKKWLFENQFQVAFRSQISKNKFNSEFLNRKAVNLNSLSQTLLNDIDVVVIDDTALNSELIRAVNGGMGLIIRAQTIKPFQDHQPLLTDTAGKISVDRRLSGMGKIVSTNILATYQWQLSGKHQEYSKFWTLLFEKALRKKIERYSYSIESSWPTIGESARIILSLPDTKAPLISVDRMKIAPRQNMELAFEWDGVFCPKNVGWTTLSINQKEENIYIYQKSDWIAAKNYEKLRSTENFIANQRKNNLKTPMVEYLLAEKLSKWWFFAGFLLAISFLWYEQRFLENK